MSDATPGQQLLTHTTLKARQREIRERFSPSLGVRLHRAIGWFGRAERDVDDSGARFIFLLIALTRNGVWAVPVYKQHRSPGDGGGRYGGSGGNSVSNEDLAGVGDSGGATETGINDSPINITINDRSANQQTWESSVSPALERVHDNRFTSPVVGKVGLWRRVVSMRGAG